MVRGQAVFVECCLEHSSDLQHKPDEEEVWSHLTYTAEVLSSQHDVFMELMLQPVYKALWHNNKP